MNKELSLQEKHNLAMNLVGRELEQEGYEFLGVNSKLKKNPQFVVLKDKKTSFIVVRPVSTVLEMNEYDTQLMLPIKEHAKKFKAKVYYAPVWLGHGDDIQNPIIKGEHYSFIYNGLIEVK